MRNFNQLTPATKPTNKKWIGGIAALSVVSIAGGFGVNAILNPESLAAGAATASTDSQTVTGDLIEYRYGAVQVEVTETAGNISSIKEIQASSSGGYERVFPLLNEAALAAQGTSFGNFSGATYSSDAYKEALANALAKLE